MGEIAMPLFFSTMLLFSVSAIQFFWRLSGYSSSLAGTICGGWLSLALGLFLRAYRYTNLPKEYEQNKLTDEWGWILMGLGAFLLVMGFLVLLSRMIKKPCEISWHANKRRETKVLCLTLILCLIGSAVYMRPQNFAGLERKYLSGDGVVIKSVSCTDEKLAEELDWATLQGDSDLLPEAQEVLRYIGTKQVRKIILDFCDVEQTETILYADIINADRRKALNVGLFDSSDGEQYLWVAEVSPIFGEAYGGIEWDNDVIYYKVIQ